MEFIAELIAELIAEFLVLEIRPTHPIWDLSPSSPAVQSARGCGASACAGLGSFLAA